eukprot:TRINITY_DN5082_c0_g1_i2.p3 TRINITY_DN5082_c0_g1~~TRINITY_DN5082_c0_g1_i2.p3  ORF type:complete len:115 (-),score=6.26 TRINITY_DN5082_c0_g1_i2:401-745(-)
MPKVNILYQKSSSCEFEPVRLLFSQNIPKEDVPVLKNFNRKGKNSSVIKLSCGKIVTAIKISEARCEESFLQQSFCTGGEDAMIFRDDGFSCWYILNVDGLFIYLCFLQKLYLF